ncbi:MAG: amidohydrolase [Parabacteroides sp.]|nr:amidohydrolase [Parabacteroides sp.]
MENADKLRIALVQAPIEWGNPEANLHRFGRQLGRLQGKADIALLPETFTTGFSMQAEAIAEPAGGPTLPAIRNWASAYNLAIAGSFIASENGRYFNRGFFVTPEGHTRLYDKRHLFRMAGENEHYTAGNAPLVVPYKGWNINLVICYDLRFPVWCRNTGNAYDVLLCCANWPEARSRAWRTLLEARAIENMAYVCGVNRVGADGNGIPFRGDSLAFSPKGEILADAENGETVRIATLDKEALLRFRAKFPAWQDMDKFVIC